LVIDGGKGLYKWHSETARDNGVNVYYSCPAVGLINCPITGDVLGIRVFRDGKYRSIGATGGVVLASGGFQASSALRTKYLGPGWDLAHVRGCQYSTGDGHKMAAQVGAKLVGNYSGCHSTAWDGNSPTDAGDRHLTNQYTKSGYPLGIMVNTVGKRFVDEGFDLRNFTYAVFGREILKQPQGIAFQIWDSDGAKLLRKEEYADEVTQNLYADTLEELADILVTKGLKDKAQFLETIAEFNAAVDDFQRENPGKKFDPAVRDGVSTQSSKTKLSPGKTNWAIPIKKGPFRAVEVTTGITFTFGGLAVDPSTGGVIAEASRKRIQGLYCAGELLGGLFWDNYPGGSGLTMGTVMGRIGGKHAAARSRRLNAKGSAEQVRAQL
jgi:succinate dehydrogenase/fumarate reductase flavoprotein subunit